MYSLLNIDNKKNFTSFFQTDKFFFYVSDRIWDCMLKLGYLPFNKNKFLKNEIILHVMFNLQHVFIILINLHKMCAIKPFIAVSSCLLNVTHRKNLQNVTRFKAIRCTNCIVKLQPTITKI